MAKIKKKNISDIPEVCRDCANFKKWNLKMDGSFDISCRKLPVSLMGNPHCKHKKHES